VGASTGGWTQVLLDAGATQVHAVEVGTAQLDASIHTDARVHSYEKTDIRTYALQADIPDFDIIVGDISFISLCAMIPTILSLASVHTQVVLLFKPQFEVHTTHLTRSGIPKKQEYRDTAWAQVSACIYANGGTVIHTAVSTLAGEAGNVETLMYVRKKEF
jgi:23S rRNA (cytidine1920-2'-O)/16S rRNA (cytidine1409-2'-O)-methyltransferase